MEIETLSNKELHSLILEWELPNIPVTDSNRNVLIKRLLKTMDETKKANKEQRRKTIAAAATTTKSTAKSATSKSPTGKSAVAVSAELEALSNKEIQKMCLHYELPNIPVTDSNRNVLLRRLQTAMNEANNNNKRRHTIQPKAAHSSDSEPRARLEAAQHISRSNVRRSVTSAIDATPSPSPRRNSPLQSHRQVVTTTAIDASPSPPMQRRLNQSYVRENQQFLPPLYSEQKDTRRERSISLSKTGVLTTSYSQESSALPEHMEVDDEDPVDESEYEVNISRNSDSFDNNHSYSNNYNFAKPYEVKPNKSPAASSYMPSYGLSATASTSYSPTYTSYTAASTSPTAKTAYESSVNYGSSYSSSNLYPKLDASLHPDNMLNQNQQKRSYNSASSTYAQEPLTAKASPLTTSSYSKPKPNTSYFNTYSYKGGYKDNNEATEFSSDDQLDRPYLSAYSRSSSSSINRRGLNTPTSGYEAPMKKRRSTLLSQHNTGGASLSTYRNENDEAEESPFRQFLIALDRQYHLKQALLLISIFVLTVFVYVFFIQP